MNSPVVDIKLEYDEKKGYYDIIVENGDIVVDNSYKTTIVLALGTDARASSEEISQVDKQRGSIIDLYTKNSNGSKLWLLEQARLDTNSKNKAVDYAFNALQYLKEEVLLKSISVTGNLTADGVVLNIELQALNGVFDKYKFNAWKNTINQ